MTLWIKRSTGWVVPKRVFQKQPVTALTPHETNGVWLNAPNLWLKLDGTWILIHKSEPVPVVVLPPLTVKIVTGTRNQVLVSTDSFVYRKAGDTKWIQSQTNTLTLALGTQYEFAYDAKSDIVKLTTLTLAQAPQDWVAYTTLVPPHRLASFDLVSKSQVYPVRRADLTTRPEKGNLDWVSTPLNTFTGWPVFQGTTPTAMFLSKLDYTRGLQTILKAAESTDNIRSATLTLRKTPENTSYPRPETVTVAPKIRLFAATNLVAATAELKDLKLDTLQEATVGTFTTGGKVQLSAGILKALLKGDSSLAFCDVGRVDVPAAENNTSWQALSPQEMAYQFSFTVPGVINGMKKEEGLATNNTSSGYLEVSWWGPADANISSPILLEKTVFDQIKDMYEALVEKLVTTKTALLARTTTITSVLAKATAGDIADLKDTSWTSWWSINLTANLVRLIEETTKEVEDKLKAASDLTEKSYAAGKLADNRADAQHLRAILQTLTKILKWLDEAYLQSQKIEDLTEDIVVDWYSYANALYPAQQLVDTRKKIEAKQEEITAKQGEIETLLQIIEDAKNALTADADLVNDKYIAMLNAQAIYLAQPTNDTLKDAYETAQKNYNNQKGIYDGRIALIETSYKKQKDTLNAELTKLNTELSKLRKTETKQLKDLEDTIKAKLATYLTQITDWLKLPN